MKTILILGASGFVGKNFLNNVQASKYNILCPYSDELDLLDKSAITSYLKNNRPDISKMKSIGYVPKTAISSPMLYWVFNSSNSTVAETHCVKTSITNRNITLFFILNKSILT